MYRILMFSIKNIALQIPLHTIWYQGAILFKHGTDNNITYFY